MKQKTLFSLVQQFLLIHLRSTRGLSENSIQSYRDTLRLFFTYIATKRKKKSYNLNFTDFSVEIVLDFLQHTENGRQNKIRTRNHRLALLRMFFSYLLNYDEERGSIYEKIINISAKRHSRRVIECLDAKEISSILNSIKCETRKGLRDHTLILLMYNTGARVQEICDLTYDSFSFDGTPRVTLVGKGNNSRVVPLWEKTCVAIKNYQNKFSTNKDGGLFLNPQGNQLTRHGVADILKRRVKIAKKYCLSLKNKRISPHVIRHTTATHLLQAGVDLSVIRSWLGHVSLNTTNQYVDINLKAKQEALSKKRPPQLKREVQSIINKNKDVISWLKTME